MGTGDASGIGRGEKRWRYARPSRTVSGRCSGAPSAAAMRAAVGMAEKIA